MGWEVGPDDLRILLTRLDHEYTGPAGIPLVITENGAVYEDVPDETGYVDDIEGRLAYICTHLAAVERAVKELGYVPNSAARMLAEMSEGTWNNGEPVLLPTRLSARESC